ncbi:MAG: glutamate--tRNA ligase [Alphaproteobacteria bacterium]|nr:glutamate--tRNA ligase [Alphaproteobacteria bacterium]
MSVVVRFAPSPTGYLHAGNARIAMINWVYAKAHDGCFMLRLDDTDAARVKPEYVAAITQDLAWLGIDWHETPVRQSARLAHYQDAAARLKAIGRLYACYETAAELDAKRKLQAAAHKPPLYDRAGLKLTADERARLEGEGRKPHYRFLLEHRTIGYDDLVRGPTTIDTASQSDPVLIKEDGTVLYTLASVVDDAALAITHVIRGEDHVTNTGTQLELFEALGASAPRFGHLSLLIGADGAPLSKRIDSLALENMRTDGIEALALASFLAKLGTGAPIEPVNALSELVAGFDLTRFGKAPARFDLAELGGLSARTIHAMSFEQACPRLATLGLGEADAAFWTVVRGNLARVDDAREWWPIVRGPLAPVIEDAAFTDQAASLLPEGAIDGGTWGAWTKRVTEASGRKGRALFHPLRLALTGRGDGPGMADLLPLIGRERALARLAGHTA